jgi:hypothetical protein
LRFTFSLYRFQPGGGSGGESSFMR